jgi:hypothetical protein
MQSFIDPLLGRARRGRGIPIVRAGGGFAAKKRLFDKLAPRDDQATRAPDECARRRVRLIAKRRSRKNAASLSDANVTEWKERNAADILSRGPHMGEVLARLDRGRLLLHLARLPEPALP